VLIEWHFSGLVEYYINITLKCHIINVMIDSWKYRCRWKGTESRNILRNIHNKFCWLVIIIGWRMRIHTVNLILLLMKFEYKLIYLNNCLHSYYNYIHYWNENNHFLLRINYISFSYVFISLSKNYIYNNISFYSLYNWF